MMVLFKTMMKEEWRIHTNLFGGILFVLFPLIILMLLFIVITFIPFFGMMENAAVVVLFIIFAFFGVNVGAFGMHGQEFMNRRFGHSSLVAYSSRSLPLSERRIFMAFIFKDIVYYLLFFVLPCFLGLSLASVFVPIPSGILLYISLFMSFLAGLSLVFLLSVIYSHSSRMLFLVLTLFALYISFFGLPHFSPYIFYQSPNIYSYMESLMLILVPFVISIAYFQADMNNKKKSYPNVLARFGFHRMLHIIALKDTIDLLRCRGGIGRIIFSLVIPMLLVGLFVELFVTIIPYVDFLVIFSIFLGVYSSSIYNWVTVYDAFTSYSFLPVKPSKVIYSKTLISIALGFISFLLLLLAYLYKPGPLMPSIVVFVSLFFYGLSMTVNITGLYPNILFFNAYNLVKYLLFIVPAPIFLILLNLLGDDYLYLSLVLIIIAYLLFYLGLRKWDRYEQLVY